MAKKRGNGEGSITKRANGKWQGYTYVASETGEPKQKYVYGNTRKEVKEKLDDILGKVQTGTYLEPCKLTVSEWIDTWLKDYMKNSLSPTTWDSYETQVRKHIKPTIGHIKLSQLQTHNLQKLYNDKSEGGRADDKEGGLSPRSIKYIHTVIHGALEQAKREQKILNNPADAVKLPKQEKPDIQYFNKDSLSMFLEKAKNSRHFPAYYLDVSTGLRRGELLALRWQDITIPSKDDPKQQGFVRVNKNLVRAKVNGKYELIFQDPKTKTSKRTIQIDKDVVKILRKHQTKQNWDKQLAGEAYQDNNLVFTTELGQPSDPRNFTRHFENLINKLIEENENFPRVTFHGLRHTYATLSLEGGMDIKTVQNNLGHATISQTGDTYSHVTDNMKENAANIIGSIVSGCLKG